jgi:hypothetical protein
MSDHTISAVAMQIAAGCARRGEQFKANTIKAMVDAAQINDWLQECEDPLDWPSAPPATWAFSSSWRAVEFFTIVVRAEQGLGNPWDTFDRD